ncbi:MAG: hypothetical protein KA153_01360 [Hyphomonadaceae bacterium]|jgi:hypothetical protein|nr:hypothetical protein [Hyphomonadaceae bacterium]
MTWKSPTTEDTKILWDEINKNPRDRVVAIVCASFLETHLEACLRLRLREEAADRLFGFNGALSSHGARTHLAHGIGLLSDDAWHDLVAISKIRNRFAHDLRVREVEDQEIKKLCAKLRLMPALLEQVARKKNEEEAMVLRSMNARTPPRLQFTNCAGSLANYLAQIAAAGPAPITDRNHLSYWSTTWQWPPPEAQGVEP